MTCQDIDTYMGRELAHKFYEWVEGQTYAICDGRRYDRDARTHMDTGCGPHGAVYYRHDVARFLNNQPVID
jgi:hypothetical protein